MIVPEYWAEGRIQQRIEKRQFTVRRFGWSDISQEDAQANADARTKEAFDRIVAGEKLPRRETKISYNGSEGLPIREQILARHGDTIITRNSYGAHCLNTPNVLFADIDFHEPRTKPPLLKTMLLLLVLGVILNAKGKDLYSWIAFGAFALCLLLSWLIERKRKRERPDPLQQGRERIRTFMQAHPNWSLRTYRTPAGLRVLVTHRTFDPQEPAVAELFQALDVDPVYTYMCRNQNCFRARLSAKPWRIGIASHMRPRPGVWPINPEHLPLRNQWIAEYEQKARGFAACKFLESFGSGLVDDTAKTVQALHDDACRAMADLPLA